MRLYVDSSVIIYGVEGASPLREIALARLARVEGTPGGMILTSRLSRLECRVLPLRNADAWLLSTYDRVFTHSAVTLAEITGAVIERAADLRARHGLKTPDAIHVATAIEWGADLPITGDRRLARRGAIKTELVEAR